jgi:hypothetical protein
VTLLGNVLTACPSALASPLTPPVPLPKTHLPPCLQVQVDPEQSQSPVHEAVTGGASVPPHPTPTKKPTETTLNALTSRETESVFTEAPR